MTKYTIEQFEGPLDLLLQMIQNEELDLTTVSLASIAEQFTDYIQKNPDNITGEELTDFLVVATQLLLLKSQLLLPNIDLDEDLHPEALETQLKLYRRFVEIAQQLQTKINQRQFLYSRTKSPLIIKSRFSPPESVDIKLLFSTMEAIIHRLEPIVILPESVMRKTVSMQEKMGQIQQLIKHSKGLSFKQILRESRSKVEKIISFLALLELVKQEEVLVKQNIPFEDIIISKSSNQ